MDPDDYDPILDNDDEYEVMPLGWDPLDEPLEDAAR